MKVSFANDEVQAAFRQATPGSAGWDLPLYNDKPVTLLPGQVELLQTGVWAWIEDDGIVGQISPRSGMGHKKGLILGNGVGTLDSDYQGQIYVSAWNRSNAAIHIKPYEAVAQVVYLHVAQLELIVCSRTEWDSTIRGGNGFGSSSS